MKKIIISESELNERIALNFKRLNEPFYDIDGVFFEILAKSAQKPVVTGQLLLIEFPLDLPEIPFLVQHRREFSDELFHAGSFSCSGVFKAYKSKQRSALFVSRPVRISGKYTVNIIERLV